MLSFSGSLSWVTGSAAALAALAYLYAMVRRMVRRIRSGLRAIAAIHAIVERELEHNHGSSMKDDLHGLAVAIGVLQRARDEDRRKLNMALSLAAKHHPEDPWLQHITRHDLAPEREDP